jgi:hypothetical protein
VVDYPRGWADAGIQLAQAVEVTVSSTGTAITDKMVILDVLANLEQKDSYWVILRDSSTNGEVCRAYGLYLIDRRVFDGQIAASIERFLTKNAKSLSAAEMAIYRTMIKDLQQ